MIFGELLGSWMENKQAFILKRRTYLRYEEIIRTQIVPSLGNLTRASLQFLFYKVFKDKS